MSSILTPEQKQALGPFLAVIVLILAGLGGVAVNTVLGGPRIPGVSEFAAIVLGGISAIVIHRLLTK